MRAPAIRRPAPKRPPRPAGGAHDGLPPSRRRPDRPHALAVVHVDGKPFTGHPGDTLASALLGSGVTLMGRSFKYHRPRGPVTAGSAEPNALMEIGEGARVDPNTRATMVELYEGLSARSQNRWPSLDFDWARELARRGLLSRRASTTRPSCGRRASGRRSTSRSSAVRRPWTGFARTRSRPLREGDAALRRVW